LTATASKIPVLFINSPSKPGADTQIQALIMRALDRERFDVHAACTPGSPGAPSASLELLSTIPDLRLRPTGFGPSLFGRSAPERLLQLPAIAAAGASLLRLALYIRRNGIRILHSSDRPRDAVPCVLLSSLTGARSVIHLHVGWGDWMTREARWALGRADALIGISKFVAGTALARGFPPSRTHVVLNAIDISRFDPAIDPGPLRRELGLTADVPVVTSISRLFHWKGHADLIRAFAVARRQVPGAKLLIVGEEDKAAGGQAGSSYPEELKALARELDVADDVLFTGFRADIPQVLAASDVFALPSFQEPFGLVFLEAMAMKKPVVALDSGGAPEVIERGRTGLLSAPRDLDALAGNLLALIRDPALRARMGEEGRAAVQARFSPKRMARDTESVYASVLKFRGHLT